MKNKTGWIEDTLKYAFLWMIGLGIVTLIVAPIYTYLVEEAMGGFIYLGFIVLGFLTKAYFVQADNYVPEDEYNGPGSNYVRKD